MQEVEQTDTFAEALKKGASAPIRTAKGLVTHPVDTVSGIASGVGSWFKDIGNAITSDDPHQEGALSAAIGYAAAKRKFAYEYGINPYTRYEPVREKLNKMARSADSRNSIQHPRGYDRSSVPDGSQGAIERTVAWGVGFSPGLQT